ncbi:MAG: integrase core domain-containing protein [Verrucomicrobiae bacterium]|nr:integrase core domain-containing protein [Verrucomicrobiae bacterium]MCP5548304.1 transposase [Akkermansiaceae bacterium]
MSLQQAMLVSPLALAISAATEEGFLPIFNGTDLSGWQLLPETADPQMEGGTIAGKIHIKPGGLRENRFVKSFPDRLHDECLNQQIFRCGTEARVVIEEWQNLSDRFPQASFLRHNPLKMSGAPVGTRTPNLLIRSRMVFL